MTDKNLKEATMYPKSQKEPPLVIKISLYISLQHEPPHLPEEPTNLLDEPTNLPNKPTNLPNDPTNDLPDEPKNLPDGSQPPPSPIETSRLIVALQTAVSRVRILISYREKL